MLCQIQILKYLLNWILDLCVLGHVRWQIFHILVACFSHTKGHFDQHKQTKQQFYSIWCIVITIEMPFFCKHEWFMTSAAKASWIKRTFLFALLCHFEPAIWKQLRLSVMKWSIALSKGAFISVLTKHFQIPSKWQKSVRGL